MKNGCLIAFLSVLGAFVFLTALAMVLGSHYTEEASYQSAPVVVLKLEGAIFNSEELLKQLNAVQRDDDVRAVVLRIDSPGGAVAPSQEIYREVLKLSQKKTVVVSMGTVAASGGYYIASASTKIVANSGTITGSIGVIMESFGLQDVLSALKIEPRTIKSGQFKDTGNPFRSQTQDERAYMQKLSDDMYKIFVSDVALGRKMDVEKVSKLAEGRIYTGREAKDVGLVDEIGNFYDAINLAKKLADLPEDAEVSWPIEPSPFEAFFDEEVMLRYVNKLFLWTQINSWPNAKMEFNP